MQKMRVAIISSGYFPVPPVKGGAIETLINILFEQNAMVHNCDLTIYSVYNDVAAKKAECQEENKISYIHIPRIIEILDYVVYYTFKYVLRKKKHMSYRYILQRLYYINAVSKSISSQDYDRLIIENHPTLLGVLKKNGNKQRFAGKYIYHAHNEILKTFGYGVYLREAREYICVSNFIGNTIHNRFPEFDPEDIKVLRNRVDEEKFRNVDIKKQQQFKEKYHIPDGFLLFTFTGRLNPEKGVKELLEAYKIARPDNSKLIIAGSYYFGSGITSEFEENLKQIAKEIKDDIVFTGNIEYEDMPYLYAVSDVIVLPSIWNDPAPLTVIESLTCGKPLITTASGGIPEYANEKNAIILQVDDLLVSNLANAIKTLSYDEDQRLVLTEHARKDSKEWKKRGYYDDFISLLGTYE